MLVASGKEWKSYCCEIMVVVEMMVDSGEGV